MAKQSTTTRKQAGSKKRSAESAPSRNGQDVASFEQELAEYLQERIKPGLNRGAIPMLARSIAKDIARRQSSEDAQSGDEVDDADSNSMEAEADEGQAQAEADDVDIDDAEDDDTEAEADDDDEAEAEADYDEEAEADDDIEAEADDDAEAEADDDLEAEGDDEAEAEADDDFDDEEGDETEAAADDDYDDEGDGEDAAESNGNGSTDFEADMRELQGELGDDWILRFSVQGDESWLTAEKDDGSQRVQASTASVLAEVVELLNDDND